MPDPQVSERMREEWNQRAREDANYYVAFGRRDQNENDFFETAKEVIAGLEWEMRRLPRVANSRTRRALEIGCGPGRLMRPMSRHFGEIHGVDVSDEMIARARQNLHGIPHAHVHANDGSGLAQFADSSFDFLYSYAVFQHIPSRDAVLGYLREAHRVLKPGALMRVQFNGLPKVSQYDTWSGVRFTANELIEFTREYDFQILALDGSSTQYMWTTWIKRESGWRQSLRPTSGVRIRRISNAYNSDPGAPPRGRFASISVWVDGLSSECDMFDLEAIVGGAPATVTYIGPMNPTGEQQINVILPDLNATGLIPLELRWLGEPIATPSTVRVIPQGPQVPAILAVTDGINYSAGLRIESRSIKASIEDVAKPQDFAATIDGHCVVDLESFCTDPLTSRYEFNFRLTPEITPGPHTLQMTLARRQFPPYSIEVV